MSKCFNLFGVKGFLFFLLFVVLSCSSNQKAELYQIGQIKTSHGEMLFWLYDETPAHKEIFIKLATTNYWDSLTFNRIIENFVIQGGCPDTPEGFDETHYLIKPKFNDRLRHVYGALGAGRDENAEKKSAGCQFYIVHNHQGIPRLDGEYMIIGQIFKGLDVLDALGKVKTDSLDVPLQPIQLDVNIIELTREELQEYGYEIKE